MSIPLLLPLERQLEETSDVAMSTGYGYGPCGRNMQVLGRERAETRERFLVIYVVVNRSNAIAAFKHESQV